MKLSQWAKKVGISYRRAWQMFKDGKIPNAMRRKRTSYRILWQSYTVSQQNSTD